MANNPGRNRDANENRDEVLVDIKSAAITTSIALPTAFSVTLAASVTSVWLVPEASTDDVRIAIGTASASTGHLPKTGVVIPGTKTILDTVQLFAGSSSKVTMFVYGPRT